jgi:anti-sigma factor RsiW
MKCDKVYLYICDNLDEDINSERCRQIKQHLAECPNCSSYLNSLKKTIALYRTLPAPPVPVETHRELFRTISTLTGTAAEPAHGRNRNPKKI